MEHLNPAIASDPTPPLSGPGHLLYRAREDLRMAPEDVAQILHLSARQIVALEQDDYQHLPGPTYVRGYLRGYAQLLGLSPEKVIDSYNALTIPPRPQSRPQSAPPPQVTSSDSLIKLVTVGVAVFVFGLVYLWSQNKEESASKPVAPSAQMSEPAATTPPASAATPGGSTAPFALSTSTTTSTPAPAVVVEPVLQTVNGGVTETPVMPPSAAPDTAMKMIPSREQAPLFGESPDTGASDPSRATTPTRADRARHSVDAAASGPRMRVALQALQESWVDVRDAHDNKLLYESVPAGRRVAIEGVAPFSIFIGNADGVRVEFNGQVVDLNRYKHGQVARFTLGEEKAGKN